MSEYDIAHLVEFLKTNLDVSIQVATLKADMTWVKWAVFMLYPLILANLGVNLFRRKDQK